jgi:AcrR family transcriptional regulator
MTQPATSLEWIDATRPSRRRATKDRLMDAAVELLLEGSFDQAPIAAIARRAECPEGAFRGRYADKETLLRAVHERFVTEAAATADAVLAIERWDGCSIPAIIRETVSFSVQLYRERENMIRAFMVRTGTEEDYRERSLALGRQIGELLRKLILARRKELLHPAPAIAAEFSARLIHSLLQARALSGDHGDHVETGSIKLTDEQVTTELVHAVLAYLGVFSTDTWNS